MNPVAIIQFLKKLSFSNIILLGFVIAVGYLWLSVKREKNQLAKELAVQREAALAKLQHEYDSMNVVTRQIEIKAAKAEAKIDSVNKVSSKIAIDLRKAKQQNEILINDYKKLNSSDAFSVFTEYLSKRPN